MRLKSTSAIAAAIASSVLLAALAATAGAQHKKPAKPAAKHAPAPTKAQIEAGSKVFMSQGCAACHAVKAGETKSAPALTHIGADKKWPATKIAAMVRDPKKTAHTTKMPAYPADKLNDKDLKNLVSYLESLK